MNEAMLKDIQEYVTLSEELRAELIEKVAELENKLALTEKTASAAVPALPARQVGDTLDRLIEVKLLDAQDKEAALSEIESDPSMLLRFIDKLAEHEKERRNAVKPLGRVRDDERSVTNPDDRRKASDKAWDEGVTNLARRF